MNILIIEDEYHTAERLESIILNYNENYSIVAKLSSVEDSIAWFSNNKMPDIIFQDISLSDGECFEIYDQLDIDVPIIFTTAYSEYALQAFKLNSIDYIVKPYNKEDIDKVFEKLKSFKNIFKASDKEILQELVFQKSSKIKNRFLIKLGDKYDYIKSKNIMYAFYDQGITFVLDFNKKKYPLDYSLTELENVLDSQLFFRINRKFIINVNSIRKISNWFNGRLKLKIEPDIDDEIIVSRERVKEFKNWLDN